MEEFLKTLAGILVILAPGIAWATNAIIARFSKCDKDREEMHNRIFALEISQGGDLPRWVRDSFGRFQNVSPEFVRLFGASRGLGASDFIGKTFDDLPQFSPKLVEALRSLDARALQNVYASQSHVEVSPGVYATVCKCVRSGPTGDIVYIGYATPEFEL